MNQAVIGEYKQVVNSANAYTSSLLSEVNSVKSKMQKNTTVIDKTLKWINDLQNQIADVNRELDDIKSTFKSTVVNESVVEEAFLFSHSTKTNTKKEDNNNKSNINKSTLSSKGKIVDCQNKINKILKELSTLSNHVAGILMSASSDKGQRAQKSARAAKYKMDKRYEDITSMWNKVKDPAKISTESVYMANFTCAIFEAIMNDLLPREDGLKILNEAEERLEKITSMKLSIYNTWQKGSITEEQRDKLLEKL